MPDERVNTTKLLQKLFKTVNVGRFMRQYENEMAETAFSDYISDLCVKNNLVPGHVINKAGIERTYGHQLFNGRRKPSRDKVLQLAFGFGMDYDKTQELLKTARKSALYPRIKRDAVVIFGLKHGYRFEEVQATLSELSLTLLGKDDRYE